MSATINVFAEKWYRWNIWQFIPSGDWLKEHKCRHKKLKFPKEKCKTINILWSIFFCPGLTKYWLQQLKRKKILAFKFLFINVKMLMQTMQNYWRVKNTYKVIKLYNWKVQIVLRTIQSYKFKIYVETKHKRNK